MKVRARAFRWIVALASLVLAPVGDPSEERPDVSGVFLGESPELQGTGLPVRFTL
jgi:hypothetical protein